MGLDYLQNQVELAHPSGSESGLFSKNSYGGDDGDSGAGADDTINNSKNANNNNNISNNNNTNQ